MISKKERIFLRLRLASLIQNLRKEKNISLIEAAVETNLSPFEILKYELGFQAPSSTLIAKLIQIYKPSTKLYLNFCCFPKRFDS